jgi:hypothetical protein
MSQPPGYGPQGINPNTGLPYGPGDVSGGDDGTRAYPQDPYGQAPGGYGAQPGYGSAPGGYGTGQPAAASAPYGNEQYGSPQYGNDQYGNPQYGSPQYGQDPYGQNAYGSPQHAQDPYGAEAAGYAPQGGPFGTATTGESQKTFIATWLLGWLLGSFGADRFYLGKFGTAIAKLLTAGGLGIWTLIDVIRTLFGATRDTEGRPLAGYEQNKKMARLVTFIVWGIGVVAGIISLIVAIALMGAGAATYESPTGESTSQAAEEPAETEAAEEPTPDATEEAETEAEPAASDLAQWADDTYGTFEAEEISGSGNDSWAVPSGVTGAIVTVSTGGDGLTLNSLDDAGDTTSGLIEFVPPNSETTLMFNAADTYMPEVSEISLEGGSWDVSIEPVSSAPELEPDASGTGSGVYLYDGESTTAQAEHSGESNFIIWQYGDALSTGLLVNEIGDWSGSVDVSAGPSVMSVDADGDWSLTLE